MDKSMNRISIDSMGIDLHTELDGTGLLTRWLSIHNTGSKPAALDAV